MLDVFLNITAVLYLICTVLLLVFVGGLGVLLVIYLLNRHHKPILPEVHDAELPSVTVQLPVYNEPQVVERLIDACIHLDYPSDKLCIQILDDSTDITAKIIQEKITTLKHSPIAPRITHIHRRNRQGYKAGALSHGLKTVDTDCVIIFDADFVPQPDFLRQTMPFFVQNLDLALIQTRWGHLNADYNALTRAQALNIDAHFAIEQTARNRAHLPMSMNGTGGIWRVEAICAAGGWSSVTLTEDLDLSYRALMQGWHFLYLPDVVVPGELPPSLKAYKMQQARWAVGSTQCLLRHSGDLLMNQYYTFPQKVMGLLHLSQYVVQPIILMIFLLTPILLWGDMFQYLPDLRLMAFAGVVPPLIIAVAQMTLYTDWYRRLLYFPAQFVVAVAVVLNNSFAVMKVLLRPDEEREFKRTPKFRLTQQTQHWSLGMDGLLIDHMTIAELFLAGYALLGFYFALKNTPALAPYMLSYAVAFVIFAVWNLYQMWRFAGKSS